MKKIILLVQILLLDLTFLFSQTNFSFNFENDKNYEGLEFSEIQKEKINNEVERLNNLDTSHAYVFRHANMYVVELLDSVQRKTCELNSSKILISSTYHYLKLSDKQIDELAKYHSSLSDSVWYKKTMDAIRPEIIKILSQQQIALMQRQDSLFLVSIYNSIINDEGRYKEKAALKKREYEITKKLYYPGLKKIANKLYKKLPEQDKILRDELSELYYSKLEKTRKYKSSIFESNGASGIPSNHVDYYNYQFLLLGKSPDLCLYWCFMKYEPDFSDLEELDLIVKKINYIINRNTVLINKYLKRKIKLQKKLKVAIDEIYREYNERRKKTTILLLQPDEKTKEVEDYMDLLLISLNGT